MFDTLLAAGATVIASEESGAHQLELYGIPTYWFAIFGFMFFGILMFITISFSGRGVVRPEHAAVVPPTWQETCERYNVR